MRVNRIMFVAAQARAELSVGEIAEKAGLSRGTVTAVKNGKSCSRETAKKLVAVLGDSIITKKEA